MEIKLINKYSFGDKVATIDKLKRKEIKEINNAMYKGVTMKSIRKVEDGVEKTEMLPVEIPLENIDYQQETMVRVICRMSQSQVDELEQEDYDLLVGKCNEIKNNQIPGSSSSRKNGGVNKD